MVRNIYLDRGCHLWGKCLTCPFDDCLQGKSADIVSRARREEAVRLHKSGLAIKEIARQLRITERQIYNYFEI